MGCSHFLNLEKMLQLAISCSEGVVAIHVIFASTHGYHPPTMIGFMRLSNNSSKRFEIVVNR
jgi:hypothetical protein